MKYVNFEIDDNGKNGKGGKREVRGFKLTTHIGVHQNLPGRGGCWTLTHVRSGLGMGRADSLALAREATKALEAAGGAALKSGTPAEITEALRDTWKDLRARNVVHA